MRQPKLLDYLLLILLALIWASAFFNIKIATYSFGPVTIAFLRVLVNNPDILILDEATSSIDSYSEDLIKNATKKITKGKTSIIIAHRLSTVESADKIIYIENGKILEYGNHKELLNIPKGKFKKLYEEQFIESELV